MRTLKCSNKYNFINVFLFLLFERGVFIWREIVGNTRGYGNPRHFVGVLFFYCFSFCCYFFISLFFTKVKNYNIFRVCLKSLIVFL